MSRLVELNEGDTVLVKTDATASSKIKGRQGVIFKTNEKTPDIFTVECEVGKKYVVFRDDMRLIKRGKRF